MTDDEKQVTASEEFPAADEIVEALQEILLPPVDDPVDLENAENALTKADQAALAALGSPVELIAKIIAANKAETGTQEVTGSTQMVADSMVSTQVPRHPQPSTSAPEFHELVRELHAWESVDSLSWSCEYRKKKVIGRGGQGTVFLTECLNEHNLPKALKVFSPEPYGDVASYQEDMRRMADVASLVYGIQVDNLVTIERFTYHNDIFLMIMRWIDGRDLSELLEPTVLEKLHACVNEDRWNHLTNVVCTAPGTTQLRLMPGIAVNIVEKCLRGLDALHSHGIVHGDVKPSNIMLDRYGSIRLVDLGSAFQISAPPRLHTWTPQYAPPEIFEGGEWTPQSDLASLGYVLIELLSGQPAVVSQNRGSDSTRTMNAARDSTLLEAKRRLPERLGELLPADVQESHELMQICRRLIDPDPQKRFASAEDALENPEGTFEFQQHLARMKLAALFSQEIKRWLADVKTALD